MRGSKVKWLASFVMSAIFCRTVTAGEYFDPGLLQNIDGKAALSDTSLLSQGYQPAGTYRVHINVNEKPIMMSNVRFEPDKNKQLVACLSFKAYQKLGVDMSKVSSKAEDNELKTPVCLWKSKFQGLNRLSISQSCSWTLPYPKQYYVMKAFREFLKKSGTMAFRRLLVIISYQASNTLKKARARKTPPTPT